MSIIDFTEEEIGTSSRYSGEKDTDSQGVLNEQEVGGVNLTIPGKPPSENHMWFYRMTQKRGMLKILKPGAQAWFDQTKLLARVQANKNKWVKPDKKKWIKDEGIPHFILWGAKKNIITG